MKVLFKNRLAGATFSSLNENTSFPLTSMLHQFLRYKYKATTFTDQIEITLPDNVSANSFWFGFSNAIEMTVRIYSNALALLETINVDCSQDNGAEYFPTHDDVRVIQIDATASVENDLQIGGIAIGFAEDLPLPTASFARLLVSNSENDQTESGQVASHYIEPITQYDLSYAGVLREYYDELINQFVLVGNGHVWCDITEENHALHKPLYCVTNLVESPTRNDGRCTFKITFLEAR
jgi:hypothetical protein